MRRVLISLEDAGVPFLLGGALALARYAGVIRRTKDIDLFFLPHDVERALEIMAELGADAELTDPRWLGKAN